MTFLQDDHGCTGLHPLLDEGTFELCDGGNQREHHLPHGCRGFDALPQRYELNAGQTELLQGSKEMLGAPSKPVKPPTGHHINFARPGGRHEPSQGRTGFRGPRDALINELLNDLPPTLSCNGPKFIKLKTNVLTVPTCAHTGIQSNSGGLGLGHGRAQAHYQPERRT